MTYWYELRTDTIKHGFRVRIFAIWTEAKQDYQECIKSLFPGESASLCMVKEIYRHSPMCPPEPAPVEVASAA